MVLDINLFRKEKGGNPELIKESQRRRFKPVEIVDEIIALDEEWRKLQFQVDEVKKELNKLKKEIGVLYKAKKAAEADALKPRKADLEKAEVETEKACQACKEQLDKKLNLVGNIVHESVPVSKDEAHNAVVTEWGEFKFNEAARRHHHELLWMIDGYDPKRGVKVAGHRAYFLKGIGVRLNQALIAYGTEFLSRRGYTALSTPLFMNKEIMARTAQLEEFDEALYTVIGEKNEEKYLIATSEQPISAFHAEEWLDPTELPIRYAGTSSCFRKEAGAHGKDTWGIFRVHQFDKIEQFCITEPEKSWEEHENMVKTAEAFYQSLELPYHVVAIVSGELNNAAAKKLDLEAWFPAFAEFRELVSASNCTDYQSRSLEVRCVSKKQDGEKKYVHMLNATLCATTRTICCILENYQTPEGVAVPKVLQPYLGGLEFIPFVKEAPVHEEPVKGKEKAEKKAGQADKKAQ
jgi:seryl-tRNA synthetase